MAAPRFEKVCAGCGHVRKATDVAPAWRLPAGPLYLPLGGGALFLFSVLKMAADIGMHVVEHNQLKGGTFIR